MAPPVALDLTVVARLELVVALLDDPLAQLGEHLLDLQAGHQLSQQWRQQAQIAHVRLDRPGDRRVLHLDRDLAPLVRPAAVHLPDAGGGRGLGVDRGEHALGPLAPFARRARRASASNRRRGRRRAASSVAPAGAPTGPRRGRGTRSSRGPARPSSPLPASPPADRRAHRSSRRSGRRAVAPARRGSRACRADPPSNEPRHRRPPARAGRSGQRGHGWASVRGRRRSSS